MINFPDHNASLDLSHNDHKGLYESAEEWVSENEWCDWKSEKDKERAVEMDSIWTIRWYPHTPVGFIGLAHHDLDELLEWANSEEFK